MTAKQWLLARAARGDGLGRYLLRLRQTGAVNVKQLVEKRDQCADRSGEGWGAQLPRH